MLTEKEKESGRKAWRLAFGDAPLERLLVLYAQCVEQLYDEESAAAHAEIVNEAMGAVFETAETIREKAEFTIELIKETLGERGFEVSVSSYEKSGLH